MTTITAPILEVGFAEAGVPNALVETLTELGITDPFPIQRDTLPSTLAGCDVLGRGKTGSGKTLAFAIPMVARVGDRRGTPRAEMRKPLGLVLAPTRELATQIAEVIKPLADKYRQRVTTIYGGVRYQKQINELKAGVDIIVACPGRLEDLIKQGYLSLDTIEITVLDEADYMADLGFLPAVTRILSQTPADGQRMLFSATLDNGVDELVRLFLNHPVTHSVDSENSPVAQMTHHVFEVNIDNKKDVIKSLASGSGRRVLFTRTKHQAMKLAKSLSDSGIPALDLHGNLSQAARDRNLAAFGNGIVNVLVATDVAARGVHVDGIELVVHVDPPEEHKAYLHRSGRTARAGAAGDVVTVMLPNQRRKTQALLKQAEIKVKPVTVYPASSEVSNLVGVAAPYVQPGTWEAAMQPERNQSKKAKQPRNAGDGRQFRERKNSQERRQPRERVIENSDAQIQDAEPKFRKPRTKSGENRNGNRNDDRRENRGERRYGERREDRRENRGEKRYEDRNDGRRENRGSNRENRSDGRKESYTSRNSDSQRSYGKNRSASAQSWETSGKSWGEGSGKSRQETSKPRNSRGSSAPKSYSSAGNNGNGGRKNASNGNKATTAKRANSAKRFR